MLPESFEKANCVGVQFVEKFEYEQMKPYFIDKIEKSPFLRLKSLLKKKFGQFWFEKMSKSEWLKTREKLVRKQENISNEKELIDFVLKEQKVQLPAD